MFIVASNSKPWLDSSPSGTSYVSPLTDQETETLRCIVPKCPRCIQNVTAAKCLSIFDVHVCSYMFILRISLGTRPWIYTRRTSEWLALPFTHGFLTFGEPRACPSSMPWFCGHRTCRHGVFNDRVESFIKVWFVLIPLHNSILFRIGYTHLVARTGWE